MTAFIIVLLTGGCHQLNYDGQIKGMYEPYVKVLPKEVSVKVAEVSKNKNAEEKTWKVCGSLCTLNDVLCNEITLKGLEKGAILVFERTGAYSAMEGMALFLSHELPGGCTLQRGRRMDPGKSTAGNL